MRERSILILLLFSLPCRADTFYVSKAGGEYDAGSNTSPYDTWAKAANSPKTVIDYIEASGSAGNTIYIDGDTFTGATDYFVLDHVNHTNLTVTGAGRGETILAPAANAVVGQSTYPDTISFQDLTFQLGSTRYAVYKEDGCDAWSFVDVDFISDSDHNQHMVYSGGDTIDFTRCRFYHKYNSGVYAVYLSGDSDSTLTSCIVGLPKFASLTTYLYLNNTGVTNINNCLVIGSRDMAVRIVGGTVNINNSIIQGGYGNGAVASVVYTSGTANIRNSHIISNPWDGDNLWTSGTIATDLNNIITNAWPKFRKTARVGYIIPCIDDSGAFSYAQQVEDVLASYGVTGTYYVTQADWSGANTAALRIMAANGTLEIACHSYSHTALSYDHAVNFAYGGADTSPTVEFTAGGVIQLRTAEHNDEVDLDTTLAAYDTMAEIVAADQSNWTITKSTTASQSAANISDYALPTSFATQGATAAPCDIDFDRTAHDAGFFLDEITNPKTWMADTLVNGGGNITDPQTGATYVCRSFGAPYNTIDATAAAEIEDAGFLSGRGAASSSYPSILIYGNDVKIYQIGCLSYAYGPGADEEATRQNARALAMAAIEGGYVLPVLGHSTTEISIAEWGYMLDEWSKFGNALKVCSQQQFADDVRATNSAWTDDEDGTFSRTYADYTDYHLVCDENDESPLVNAGLNLADTYATDFDGNSQNDYGSSWEIGPYVYYESTGPRYDRGLRARYRR